MTRRSGLGRGLDALIPGDDQSLSGVIQIPVAEIIPNPRQPRSQFGDEDLEELATSIKQFGLIQPVIVSEDPDNQGKFVLIAGERRWLAARKTGLEKIPAIVREASDQERLELALVENVQRSDLNPLETAEAFRQLVEDFHLSHDEVASRVNKSRSSVTNTLRLLKLPEDVQAALLRGSISEGHARALLGLTLPQAQSSALQTILYHGLNVRQTEELVQRLNGDKPSRPPKPGLPPDLMALETRLRDRLGTKVRLTHARNGGTIVIHYYSDEELNSLIEQLMDED